jgi:quercetin dioxygenase-like cupin family protein
MGSYQVVSDTRTPETSLRLLKIAPAERVEPHYHKLSTQIYVVVTGSVQVRLGDGRFEAHPFETVRIPPLTVHGLSASTSALVLSICVPPLAPDDQHPVAPGQGGAVYNK